MIDVTKNRLDVKVKADSIGHANEDNEFLAEIEGLRDKSKGTPAIRRDSKGRNRIPQRKFKRVSARQKQAVGRL
jgi:hypothetical protein